MMLFVEYIYNFTKNYFCRCVQSCAISYYWIVIKIVFHLCQRLKFAKYSTDEKKPQHFSGNSLNFRAKDFNCQYQNILSWVLHISCQFSTFIGGSRISPRDHLLTRHPGFRKFTFVISLRMTFTVIELWRRNRHQCKWPNFFSRFEVDHVHKNHTRMDPTLF